MASRPRAAARARSAPRPFERAMPPGSLGAPAPARARASGAPRSRRQVQVLSAASCPAAPRLRQPAAPPSASAARLPGLWVSCPLGRVSGIPAAAPRIAKRPGRPRLLRRSGVRSCHGRAPLSVGPQPPPRRDPRLLLELVGVLSAPGPDFLPSRWEGDGPWPASNRAGKQASVEGEGGSRRRPSPRARARPGGACPLPLSPPPRPPRV